MLINEFNLFIKFMESNQKNALIKKLINTEVDTKDF